jgi:hypothetical protein
MLVNAISTLVYAILTLIYAILTLSNAILTLFSGFRKTFDLGSEIPLTSSTLSIGTVAFRGLPPMLSTRRSP